MPLDDLPVPQQDCTEAVCARGGPDRDRERDRERTRSAARSNHRWGHGCLLQRRPRPNFGVRGSAEDWVILPMLDGAVFTDPQDTGTQDVGSPSPVSPAKVLEVGQAPIEEPHRKPGGAITLAGALSAVLLVAAVIFAGGPAGSEVGVLAHRAAPGLRIVILGDSSAGRDSCGRCETYGERLAAGLQESGRDVVLEDLSWGSNASPGASVPGLIGFLRANSTARQAVASADLVVLALGDRDLEMIFTDQVCGSVTRRSQPGPTDRQRSCVDRALGQHRRLLQTLITAVVDLRGGAPHSCG